MNTFDELNLPQSLAVTLTTLNFTTPTPIQAQAIPPALEGSDILGSAQTGTGKTAAFMIPLIVNLMNNPDSKALVMAPTRELATQVMDMTRKLLGHNAGIRLALLIGGEPMPKQFGQLNGSPRLIIGTPGRINDHCRRNAKLLRNFDFVVLDEADRMLDMGFSVQIDAILEYMPEQRQTLMFSATFSDPIVRFANKYLNNPVRVAVKADKITADKIKHDVVYLDRAQKFKSLQQELETRQGSVIVFVKTRRDADYIAERISDEAADGSNDNRAEPIHGDLRQRQRDRTIKGFKNKNFRVLVATDIAARGLDIPHIEHVINYDLPQNAEDYVHRIGRTARAGMEGAAVCFVTPQDNRMWRDIQRVVFPGQASDEPRRERGDRNDRNDRGGKRGGGFDRNKSYGAKKQGGGNGGNRRDYGDQPRHVSEWKKTDKKKSYNRDDNNQSRDKWSPMGEERGERSDRNDRPFKEKSWGNREDRGGDRSERKSYGDKPRFAEKSGEKRSYGDKPRFAEKSGEKKSWGDKPRSSERSGEKKTWGDKPRSSERSGEKKPWGDKPRSSERSGEKKPWGDKPRSSERSGEKKTWGDKPRFAEKSGGKGKPAFKGKSADKGGNFRKRRDSAA